MSDQTLQQVADSLATTLHRSVAIDDHQMRLLVASRHFGDEDPVRMHTLLHRDLAPQNRRYVQALGIAGWSRPQRVPGNADLAAVARVCMPVRWQGELLGYLWLIDPEQTLDDDQLGQAQDAAAAAGLVLHRQRRQGADDQAQQEALLRHLLRAGAKTLSEDRPPAPESGLLLRDPRYAAVVVVEVDTADRSSEGVDVVLRDVLADVRRSLAPRSALMLVDGTRGVLLTTASRRSSPAGILAAGHRVRSRVRRDLGAFDIGVGLGGVVEGLDQVRASYDQALLALRARTVLPEGDVVSWADLGVYALLLQLEPAVLASTTYRPAVELVAAADGTGRLLATLEAYLTRAGDAQRTAADLQIHRTTLYNRLRRVEQVAGVDLDDGEDRLVLHLGIRLRQLRQGTSD